MDNYIEYQRFLSVDLASDLIEILDKNNLPFQIDDSALRFQVVSSLDPSLNQVIVRIRERDFEIVNRLTGLNNIEEDHYLYTFSDADIIDVIANPKDWTTEEQTIANLIVKKRCLNITSEDIRQARLRKVEENKALEQNKPVNKTYTWFMTIGLLSILNTIIMANNSHLHFMFGLGYSQVVDGIFYSIFNGYQLFGILISLIFSSFFIVLWHFAKANKNWAYITGLSIYGLDTFIFIYCKDWLSTGFHVIAFFIIITGYLKSIEKKKIVA